MGEFTAIDWCDHTFNPWIGCAKVSPECLHCYAETLMDTRYGRVQWGVNGTRSRTSDANWKQPLAWNRKAEEAGRRARVFSASLADLFEDRTELIPWRADLWKLVEVTPWLEWLLLTKRPGNVLRMVPSAWIKDGFPLNVRIGTSAGTQKTANRLIPKLLEIPALNFLSMEPLLGPVNLKYVRVSPFTHCTDVLTGISEIQKFSVGLPGPRIDWVIVGGESGPRARPMFSEWAELIRDQCRAAGIPFFFKQWGEWLSATDCFLRFVRYPMGGTCPAYNYGSGRTSYRVGRKLAGRELDGRTWDEYPEG